MHIFNSFTKKELTINISTPTPHLLLPSPSATARNRNHRLTRNPKTGSRIRVRPTFQHRPTRHFDKTRSDLVKTPRLGI